jgi:hypothetical protein
MLALLELGDGHYSVVGNSVIPPLALLTFSTTPFLSLAQMTALIPLAALRSSRPFAGALAVLVGLLFCLPVSAQAPTHAGHSAADSHDEGVFVVRMGSDGQAVCESASLEDLETLGRSSGPLNLTVVPSTNHPRDITGMRILLRATDQLLGFPDALLAFRRSAARWERAITTPITVVIDVDYGPERFNSGPFGPNILASASSAIQEIDGGVQAMVDALKANHADDEQLLALYDAIPIPTPSTANLIVGEDTTVANLGTASGTLPNLQALGFAPADVDPDPTVNPFGSVPNIGFNSAFAYDFEPADGISPNATDFEGVAVHEIGHALGFVSVIGGGGPPSNRFRTWDLFRVRPEAVQPGESLYDGEGWETAKRVVTPGPVNTEILLVTDDGTVYFEPVQVFFDGLDEYEVSTATGGRQGGDGQQASHWRDDALRPPGPNRKIGIMDPNLGRGSRDEFNDNDLRVLEVIGYNVLYAPAVTDAAFTVNGEAYAVAAPDSLEFVDLGDIDAGASTELTFGLSNIGSRVLDYSAEVELEVAIPAETDPTISLSSSGGAIAAGESETITLTVAYDQRAVFYGTLRVETNVDSALVIDVPFRFSVNGATAPQLATSVDELGDLGDFSAEDTETRTVTITNEGNLDLDYQAVGALARRAIPFDTTPDAARGTSLDRSPLAAFFGAAARGGEEPILEEDFSDGLGVFIPGEVCGPDEEEECDWQTVEIGPALLEGHSAPSTAYFGTVFETAAGADSLQYENLRSGRLISPALDVSGVAQEDLVVLTFNTYLQAEEGFDFASVLVSLDDGDTYQEVATSDGGILQNTEAWESVMIELPQFSGYPAPVRIAFQFVSDQLITDTGWFVDDVMLTTLPGANPLFVTPVVGTLTEADPSEELTLTVQGSALEPGFYRGSLQIVSNSLEFSSAGVPVGFTDDGLRVLEASESLPFTLTVGDPSFPTLSAEDETIAVTVPEGENAEEEIEVTNTGDAPLTYLRVLEPALSSFSDPDGEARLMALDGGAAKQAAPASEEMELSSDLAEGAFSAALEGARASIAGGDSLFSIALPGANLPIGIAQLPDGRVVVADANNGGQTYVLAEDLSEVEAVLPGFAGTNQVGGLTYNDKTGTLWYAILQLGQVYEATLGEGGVQLTGRFFNVSFAPVGAAYSPELDAFFITQFQTALVYAIDMEGNVLPGYPIAAPGRSNALPGVSLTDGVLEIGGGNLNYLQLDQFGRFYAESEIIEVPPTLLGGSARINGLLRSKTDPNGVSYYLANPASGVVRVVGVDPTDLPAYTETPVEAGEPLYGFDLNADETRSLALRIEAENLDAGSYADTLAFLTNNPDDRIVRIPVEITVDATTANEDGASTPAKFAIHQNFPNPFAGRTKLKFDVPTSVRATLTVYNVLGQRVAVLMDDDVLDAGAYEVSFDASALASGTYIVRLQAGEFIGTQRLTLVK